MPCCGGFTIDELGIYEICTVCGWEDDPVQSADPDYAGGANSCSLREAQLLWRKRKPSKHKIGAHSDLVETIEYSRGDGAVQRKELLFLLFSTGRHCPGHTC
ncbi:CPCC family cysteine-rich protein [Cupriavidus necator]|uniref:CPCC family cysteine-rich protein n=1 Tax=Cupriavidus necator TaxID=106590 RepID=UPI00339D402B